MPQQTQNAYLLENVRVVFPDRIAENGAIVVRDGRIVSVEASSFPDLERIDGNGLLVAPGFFDVHCHGDGQHCFLTEGAQVAETLYKNGTTSVLMTMSYFDMQPGELARQVETYWENRSPLERHIVAGVHLEGPYINYRYGAGTKYCQPRNPDPAEYEAVLARWKDVVRYWMLAPELEGSVAFTEAAHRAGVVLAAGHTEAGLSDLEAVKGLRVATHWSNATGRPAKGGGVITPGIDEFALSNDDMLAEIICDSAGLHVHPLMTRLLYKTKGADGILLITDATRFRENYISPKEGADVNFNTDGQLSGSRLSMPAAARNFRRCTDCSIPEIFRMGSLNAAKLFGMDSEIGSIAVGKCANLILLDEDFNIHRVWCTQKLAIP